jgi:DNA-binding response OmpR family regulator
LTVSSGPGQRPHVAVLADDLIWATRLAGHVRSAGAEPVAARDLAGFLAALGGTSLAIVDLTARGYDGVAAIEQATASGARVLAVGQHDDRELRQRALAAGAERVFAYRKLFEDGPRTLEAWLVGSPAGEDATR